MKIKLKEYINFLSKYLKTQKLRVILLAVVLLSGIGLQLISPQISRYFIDEAKNGAAVKNLTMAAVMFIGVAFVAQLFNIISTYLGQNIAWKATNDIRIDLIEHCVNLDMSFHKEHQSGELIERVDGDVSQLFGLFSNIILNVINNFLLLTGILILLFREGFIIGLSFTGFAILAIYFLWHVKSKTESHWVKASEMNAKFYGFLGEQISSTEDIASSGAKKYVMKSFYKITRKMFPIIKKAKLTWASMWSAALIIFAAGNVIAFVLSAYMWKEKLITVGTAYLIFNYTEILRRPIDEIRVNLQELQVSGASIVRIKELFDIESKLKDGTNTLDSSKPLSVEFKNVDFEYEEDVQVLKNISLNVKEGRILGVLGHTGSGKTTLARLVVRLYDVTKGEILINNKNITSISLDELSKNIAYVTQNVQLFTASVRDNITLFNKDVEDETILSIIEDLGIGQWYDNLPEGLDTMIEAGGGSLSAGEAQLLAFVRVFLKNPGLIILDEATSRIDPITEQLIEKALNKLLENRTCIIIAHRLGTLQRANDILVLGNGNIVEFGEREELLNDVQSKYYNLLQHGIEEELV